MLLFFKLLFIYALLMVLSCGRLMAQNYLMLDRLGTKRNTSFNEGETIRFKLKSEDFFRKDKITGLEDSTIFFENYKVYLSEMEKIDIRNKSLSGFNFNVTGRRIQIAGAGYILIDQFNKNIIQGRKWEFEKDVWITGGIIFGVGTILRFFNRNKFTISPKNKIYIVEMLKQ